MAADRRNALQVLKGELEFLEQGGYQNFARTSWRPQFVFEDSPTCLYSDTPAQRRPCSACVLMQFVPTDCRREQTPCRYIPLNAEGETLDSLYRTGTPDEIEAAVAEWLKTKIPALEEVQPSYPGLGLKPLRIR